MFILEMFILKILFNLRFDSIRHFGFCIKWGRVSR